MDIKPLAYMSQDKLTRPFHEAAVVEKFFKEKDISKMTPLYAIPPGYALVPIEPTQEMREAFHDADEEWQCGEDDNIVSPDYQWAAMLKAGGVK